MDGWLDAQKKSSSDAMDWLENNPGSSYWFSGYDSESWGEGDYYIYLSTTDIAGKIVEITHEVTEIGKKDKNCKSPNMLLIFVISFFEVVTLQTVLLFLMDFMRG